MATIYFYNPKIDYCHNDKENVSNLAKEMVKKIAAKSLSINQNDLEFEIGNNGKPYFKNIDNFHFNISHCENVIAIAVDIEEIGIDIEKIRKADFRICDRFFTKKEKEYVGQKDIHFFEIWTKKEAYIKHKGLALKNLKDAQSDNVYTTQIENYIISVSCNEISNIDIIVLENSKDL